MLSKLNIINFILRKSMHKYVRQILKIYITSILQTTSSTRKLAHSSYTANLLSCIEQVYTLTNQLCNRTFCES